MKTGDTVTVDADTEEWGRVCGTATVEDVNEDGTVQVTAHSIRAMITVESNEVYEVTR